jgi:hypothetical protein
VEQRLTEALGELVFVCAAYTAYRALDALAVARRDRLKAERLAAEAARLVVEDLDRQERLEREDATARSILAGAGLL